MKSQAEPEIHIACANGDVERVKQLLDDDLASLFSKNEAGSTVVAILEQNIREKEGLESGNYKTIIRLIVDHLARCIDGKRNLYP